MIRDLHHSWRTSVAGLLDMIAYRDHQHKSHIGMHAGILAEGGRVRGI